MKKTILFLTLSTAIIFCSFQNNSTPVIEKNIAECSQQQGVYVFAFCKPKANYDYLGSVKTTLVFSDPTPSNRIKFAIKKMKSQFPTANGIIFTDDDMSKADAILLK